LDPGFLLGGEADLLVAAAGIGDGQDPHGMAATVGAHGAARAMADVAVEQRAAEDLGSGREGSGEFGPGFWDLVIHSNE